MYVVSKWGFRAIPPVTLAFLRVSTGAAVLLGLVRVAYPRRSFTRRDRRGFAVLGVWVAVTMGTQFVGTDLTTASEGSLVTVLTPVFTLALGVSLLGEALTARKFVGTALAGTLVVLVGQYELAALGAGSAAGIGFLVVGSAGWAAYAVYGKPLIRRYSALETATYSTAFAVPLLAVLVPVELGLTEATIRTVSVTGPLVAAVLYLGVLSTAVAWYCWYKGIEVTDTGTVAVFFFAQPVVGAALGTAFLGESIGTEFFVGALLMAFGVYLVTTA